MATAIPVASAPNKPSGFTAGGGNATAALAWGYPTSPWVYLAKWQYSSDGGTTWADIPANSGRYRVCGRGEDLIYRCVVTETPAQGGNINTREATITKLSSDTSTNLSNGVVYSFKIRGVNDKGGTASDDASAAMLPLAPAIGSLAVGDEQITLNWTKNSADAAVSSWQYRYKPRSSSESGYTGWTAVPGSTASTTSYTVTGLTNGTSYTFQVRGSNSTGTGPASSESSSATPAIQPPAKPTGLAAAVGDTEITLTWDNPGNHRITKWQYSKDNGATWTDVPNSSASTTTYTVPGLTNETEYTFRVRAYTTSEGPQSDSVKATPKPVAATPTNFTATVDSSVASQAVKLTWDAQSTATDWEIRYKTTGGYGHWADICDSNCTAGTLATYTFTDLHNNVLYTFQLRAQNNIGWGLPATDSARPLASVPAAPTLAAEGGNAQVDLTWSYAGSIWADKWQYSTDNGSNWADVASSDNDTRSATITKLSSDTSTDLSNGKSYTLKVRAVNTKGNGAASAAVTEPTLPLIPASLTASGGNMQVTLTWSKSSSDTTVTGWEYRYKTTGGYGSWTSVSGGSTTSVTVTGLDNSATYTFQLRAQNAAGVGPSKTSSDASTVPGKPTNPSPMPGQPSGPTATPGTEKVTLRWTNPGGTLTSHSYRYKPKSSTEPGYTDWKDISGGSAKSKEVTGLTAGVSYTFQVRANNAAGDGTPSDKVSAWTYPAAPANLSASPGDKQVSLTWDDPSNSSITRYEYQQTTTGSCSGGWTQMTGSDASTTQHVVKSLTNGNAYTFCVASLQRRKRGRLHQGDCHAAAGPAAPTSVSASATGTTSATVTWSYANDSLIDKFQVRYRAGTGNWSSWSNVAKAKSYSVSSGLTHGTVYTFEVRAVNNQAKNSIGAQARAATSPAKPAGFSVKPAVQQATLSWNDPGYPSITSWEYRYKSTGGIRILESHFQQRRDHHIPRGDEPHQQQGVHLPGEGSQPGGQRPGLGGGPSDAAGAGQAQQSGPPRPASRR